MTAEALHLSLPLVAQAIDGETSPLAWMATGAAIAAAAFGAGIVAARWRHGRAVDRLARSFDDLVDGRAAPHDVAQVHGKVPGSLAPVAGAVRRAARAFTAREQSMSARLRELETILHSTANGFVAIDPQQRVVDMNSAAESMLGVSPDSARGRLLAEVARQPAVNRFAMDALRLGEQIDAQLDLEGDVRRAVRATAEPLRDASERVVGALISLQDVTQLRRLESLRSDFVSNVSHELRTPITAIKGYVETLLQIGTDNPDQAKRFLEIVHRNTVRLSMLVEDLLSLASLEQAESDARGGIEFEPVAASLVVSQVLDELAPRAEARGVPLVTELEPNLSVHVNRVLAEQALANLVSNAIRYAPEGSPVVISARSLDDATAEFAVSDRGPGIAPAHLERIFERFYRVDRARSRPARGDGGGTGLGLAIVKHIAQAHRGRVHVESAVGLGSRFSVTFPKAAPTPAGGAPLTAGHPVSDRR
ncbi:MAG: ATP-binding protein [Phycisphaerales bacterium]